MPFSIRNPMHTNNIKAHEAAIKCRCTSINKNDYSKITVLIIEPGKEPYIKNISPSLESMQAEVNGLIQVIYPFEDPISLICNEEAKLLNMPLNRALYDECGNIYDIISGTFILAGFSCDSFTSLSSSQIDKYRKLFNKNEYFAIFDGKIIILPFPI